MNAENQISDDSRKILGRLVFGSILLALAYRFFSNVLLHQLEAPVLKYAWVDVTYWLAHFLSIPEVLAGHFWIALIFDFLLIGSALMSFLNANKRIYPIIFGILFGLYFLTFNSYSAHHTHCMVGILLVSIPFWFRDQTSFRFLWDGLRYYTLFIYFSAFLWKLFRGSLIYAEQGKSIFLHETATYIHQNPDGFFSGIYSKIIDQPGLAFAIITAGALLEAVFIIGFFTRKLDWLWFILPVLFHTMTYIFLDVFFFEILILNFTFLTYTQIQRFRLIAL